MRQLRILGNHDLRTFAGKWGQPSSPIWHGSNVHHVTINECITSSLTEVAEGELNKVFKWVWGFLY